MFARTKPNNVYLAACDAFANGKPPSARHSIAGSQPVIGRDSFLNPR